MSDENDLTPDEPLRDQVRDPKDTLSAFAVMMAEFAKNDPMKCEVIDNTEAALAAAVERHSKDGRRLAAVSNAGLPADKRRVTFLPESAFLKPGEEQKPPQKPRDVRDWLNEKLSARE